MSEPLEPYQMTAHLERIGYAVIHASELAQLREENQRLHRFVIDSGTTCYACETCGRARTTRECVWCERDKLRRDAQVSHDLASRFRPIPAGGSGVVGPFMYKDLCGLLLDERDRLREALELIKEDFEFTERNDGYGERSRAYYDTVCEALRETDPCADHTKDG